MLFLDLKLKVDNVEAEELDRDIRIIETHWVNVYELLIAGFAVVSTRHHQIHGVILILKMASGGAFLCRVCKYHAVSCCACRVLFSSPLSTIQPLFSIVITSLLLVVNLIYSPSPQYLAP